MKLFKTLFTFLITIVCLESHGQTPWVLNGNAVAPGDFIYRKEMTDKECLHIIIQLNLQKGQRPELASLAGGEATA